MTTPQLSTTQPANATPRLIVPGGAPRRRRSKLPWLAGLGSFMLCVLPVVLLAGAGNPPCLTPGAVNTPAGGGPLAAGLYAQPLRLQPARWYRVGATEYGGPGDPSSGAWGSSGVYLPAHPDTFAELSVLDHNPANGGRFTFTDANALSNLPYLTGLRIANGTVEKVLYKRDIGYGQGPGQRIANRQPYRLDVWWQSAGPLGIAKTPVNIELAPATGAAVTLGQLPASPQAEGASTTDPGCAAATSARGIPLPLVPGSQTKILPSGLAAAGRDAPAAVRAMVAAGNRLYGKPYVYGGAHCCSLDTLQPGYDCSSAVSYLLHAGRALGPSALDSTGLSKWGLPGPGRYVTVYANPGHAFMYVAGLRLDTSHTAIDSGPNQTQDGPRWRVYPTVPDWASWTVRHPPGL